MKFSIIIPTFNAESVIQDCLESLSQQTFSNYEIIIKDGLSTDGTGDIIRRFQQKGLPISFISDKDEGIYDAMNRGIRRAKGEWVYFMGSDDKLFNDNVLKDVSNNLNASIDIGYGDIMKEPANHIESGEWDFLTLLNVTPNHQRFFYRTSLFQKHNAFNLRYPISADYDLNIRFFCDTHITKKYFPICISKYNTRGFSGDKIDINFWEDFSRVLAKPLAPFLPEKEIYGRLRFFCWHQIQRKNYGEAFSLFLKILYKTRKMDFLRHSLSQVYGQLRSK